MACTSCVEYLHVGDIGTAIRITLQDLDTSCVASGVNVSGVTVKRIIFEKPDSTTVSRLAQFTTDGTDGKIQYTMVSGDLNIAGEWRVQAYVEYPPPSGSWKSDIGRFRVLPNL